MCVYVAGGGRGRVPQAEGNHKLWCSEPCVWATLRATAHSSCPSALSPRSLCASPLSLRPVGLTSSHPRILSFLSLSLLLLLSLPFMIFLLSLPLPPPIFPGLQLPGTQRLPSDFQVLTFNCDSWKPLCLGMETHRTPGQACTGRLCL